MSNNIQYINPLSSRRKDEEDEEQNLLFDVKEPVSSSYSSEEDTVKVKNNLQKLGYYETPSYGMTPYADDTMFEGIKKLQKDHGLTVDGRITPGGETAAKISEKLSKQSNSSANILNASIQPSRIGNDADKIKVAINGEVSKDNGYITNIKNWYSEKKRVDKLKISDENKHQYMSCLAGNAGIPMAVTGLAVGAAKEDYDLFYKSLNQEKYGGWENIRQDSKKDIKNNIKGLWYGLSNKNADCKNLLKKKLP